MILCLIGVLVCLMSSAMAAGPDSRLRFAEFTFDPVEREPELPAGWNRGAVGTDDVRIVQFDGPVTDEALTDLRAAGLTPLRYVYPNAYLVWGRETDRTRTSNISRLRWSGDFAPAFRVQPQWRELNNTARDWNVLLVAGAPADSAVTALEALGANVSGLRAIDERLAVAGIELRGDRVREAAHIPGVISIQARPGAPSARAEYAAQLSAGNVDGNGIGLPGYAAWLAGLGLSGDGVMVGHVDDGFDPAHPDLASSAAPCSGASCGSAVSQHGTHAAGIIAGDASSGALDPTGFLSGQGVAPGVQLVGQLYSPIALLPTGMLDLMRDSTENGALLSSNSWGRSSLTLGYDIHTLLVDAGVRDTDVARPGHQSLIYVQALENGAGGTSSQGVPDEAKNTISVGATVAFANDGNPDPATKNLAPVTAHGPALDGRTIPHLVAPGCFVWSTWPSGFGADHGAMCGTSAAAPQVTGAIALFIEHYRNLGLGDPSPALVKSAILPVAHDLDGGLDADGVAMGHRPDSRQGWGRLNLNAVVDSPTGSVQYHDQARLFHATSEEWLRVVTPVDPAKPMRIMLAWTDAPGHGLGGATPAWNNDLDLVVEAGGSTYLGNVFGTDGLSATGGTADPANNAEGVFLSGFTGGEEVTVRVVAANLNSDGVPGNDDETDQDFALSCYNCEFVPAFALETQPSILDVCAPADAAWDVSVESLGGYAGVVDLDVSGVPAGATATFSADPATAGSVSTLTISDTDLAADGDYALQLSGTTPEWSRDLPLELRLRLAPPASAMLATPSTGAIEQDPQPTLGWTADPWADRYQVELAEDGTFDEIVYSAITTAASHVVEIVLREQTTYHWRIRATNACGFGGISSVWTFTTGTLTPLLLVDDDGDLDDVQSDYTGSLDAIGASYDVWDVWGVHNGNEPDEATLARYRQIVWFSGVEDFYAGPNEFSEQRLELWLDRGGCMLMSSADYIYNGGFDDFVTERFGVSNANEDTGQNSVTGQGSVFGAVGPLSLGNVNPFDDYSDVLTPDLTAEIAFSGDQGTAAIDKDTGYYRTVFAAFGLERLPSTSTGLDLVLGTYLTWCDGLATLDGDGDGVLNADDCVAGDATVSGAPGPITDLMLGREEFSWSVPVAGNGAIYDILRSHDRSDFYNATCVATGVEQTAAYADIVDPAAGQIFYYLGRARNACGQSDLGQLLSGSPRHGIACE